MNRYDVLFVVGCPRSGTTWLQLLLERSPRVATAPETQIFSYYLDHFRKQWIHEHEGPGAKLQGRAGLSRLLEADEFRDLCATAARFVLDRIHTTRPDATLVVEKSPRHALLTDWIGEVLPDARVLHLVRDPRDVAASLIKAGRSWGRGWAPTNPIEAGRMWRAHVEGARRGAARGAALYREVRYDELRAAPEEGFAGVLDWLGLPSDPGFVSDAVEACSLERLRQGADDEERPVPGGTSPRGFFGKGSVGGWAEVLGRGGAKQVEAVCWDLMREYGYEPEVATSGGPTLRMRLHDAVRRVRESADWQLQRLADRV